MKIHSLAAALGAAALMTIAIPAGSATAGTGGVSFSITSIQASDYAVRAGGCHSIPVVATHNAPSSVDDIDVRAELWQGSKYLETISLSDDGPGRLTGDYFYCSSDSVGTFRLGPSEVSWSALTSDDFLSGTFTSGTTATFSIKQASSISKPKWSKKGRIATVTTKGSWFSLYSSSWKHDPKGIVNRLQSRVDSKHNWKTIKTARSDKRGVSTFKIKPKRRMHYQVVQGDTKNTFGAASPSITRK